MEFGELKSNLSQFVKQTYLRAISTTTKVEEMRDPTRMLIDYLIKIVYPDSFFVIKSINQPQDTSNLDNFEQSVSIISQRFENFCKQHAQKVESKINLILTKQSEHERIWLQLGQFKSNAEGVFRDVNSYLGSIVDQLRVESLMSKQLKTQTTAKVSQVIEAAMSQISQKQIKNQYEFQLPQEESKEEVIVPLTIKTMQQKIMQKLQGLEPVFITRLTEDFLPQKKQAQSFQFPNQFSYDVHLVGVFVQSTAWQWNFIFSDESRSQLASASYYKGFEEKRVHVEIRRILAQVWKDTRLIALQIFDEQGMRILEAGESQNGVFKNDAQSCKIKEILLEKGERIVGVKSGQRNRPAYHFDLQFVIGRIN